MISSCAQCTGEKLPVVSSLRFGRFVGDHFLIMFLPDNNKYIWMRNDVSTTCEGAGGIHTVEFGAKHCWVECGLPILENDNTDIIPCYVFC